MQKCIISFSSISSFYKHVSKVYPNLCTKFSIGIVMGVQKFLKNI
jgi:hypothetical protein